MDRLQEILGKLGSVTTSEFSPKDWEQFKVDDWNNTIGNRNEEDGYNCPICKNKGTIAKLLDYGNGTYSHCFADCKCVETRNSIMRMKRSGLKDIIKDYTFDKFVASEPWQQTIKEAAVNYSENPNGWFALFGQSGCGKTHLCTAISRKFLLDGKRVVYMLWRDEIVRIKDAARGGDDSEELRKLLDRYKTADVLYIDDLFKTGRAADNTMPKPTPADINYAFEIINYRYNNPALFTIISSEMSIDELLDIDEAIGGRIYERATAFTIGKSREKNYRLKKAATL
jgi:DNA replication protein DnaC